MSELEFWTLIGWSFNAGMFLLHLSMTVLSFLVAQGYMAGYVEKDTFKPFKRGKSAKNP
jgi:hypothetical protein